MDLCTDYGEQGVVQGVLEELRAATDRALKVGVHRDQLLWDPGLGFAKTTAQNLTLLQQLNTLVDEGIPLLLGTLAQTFYRGCIG